jgi:anti-sigma B factor antagonist
MTFGTILENEALVLYIRGELDAVSVSELREMLDELAGAGHRSVIVDLGGLRVIDSSGVGAIVSLYKRVRAHGGSACVRGARDQPLAIFKLLKLDRVLASEEAAAA